MGLSSENGWWENQCPCGDEQCCMCGRLACTGCVYENITRTEQQENDYKIELSNTINRNRYIRLVRRIEEIEKLLYIKTTNSEYFL